MKEHNNNNTSTGTGTGLFGSPYRASRGSEGRVGAGTGMGSAGTGVGDNRAGGGKSGPTNDCNEDKGMSHSYIPSRLHSLLPSLYLSFPVTLPLSLTFILTSSLPLFLLPSYTTFPPPSLPSFHPLTLLISPLSRLHPSYLSTDQTPTFNTHTYSNTLNVPQSAHL